MKSYIIFFILQLFTSVLSGSAQCCDCRIRIDSLDRSYLFQVTDKHPQIHSRHFYHWFKSGRLHQTQGSYYGKLLHGYYKVVDKERRLLEQGRFKLGEKKGCWRTWHENGRLKSCIRNRFWDGALRVEEYAPDGHLLKKGFEKNNRFTGRQVVFVKDSAVVVMYKKGIRQPAKKK